MSAQRQALGKTRGKLDIMVIGKWEMCTGEDCVPSIIETQSGPILSLWEINPTVL